MKQLNKALYPGIGRSQAGTEAAQSIMLPVVKTQKLRY